MFNCSLCYHSRHDNSLDSVFACNCCEEGSFFEPANSEEIICPYCGNEEVDCYDTEIRQNEIVRHFCCDCGKQFVVRYSQTFYGPETA